MKRNIVNLRRLFLIFFISITIEVYSYRSQLISKRKGLCFRTVLKKFTLQGDYFVSFMHAFADIVHIGNITGHQFVCDAIEFEASTANQNFGAFFLKGFRWSAICSFSAGSFTPSFMKRTYLGGSLDSQRV